MTALIWDMDGTLLNSYDSIIDRIQATLRNYNLSYSENVIKDAVLKTSTQDFLRCIENRYSIADDLFLYYQSLPVISEDITLMPYTKEVLSSLNANGFQNYVFTHRGKNLYKILEYNGILSSFKEIVDGESGFPRKPSPEALDYLIAGNSLDKNTTFYIGDRQIDGECARNAGIKMIFYRSYEKTVMDSSLFDYEITDLRQIFKIFTI